MLDRDGVVLSKTNPPRACQACPGRLTQQRASTVVDGFDFGAAPSAPPPAAAETPEDGETAPAPSHALATDGPLNLAPRAIDEGNAFMINSMLRDVVKRGTGRAALVLERDDIGGKTGSTNDHRDAWFSGFGGDLVTTVWVGKDDFKSLGRGEYGGRAALPIWISFMRTALENVPVVEPVPPPSLVVASISPATGRIVPEGTPGSITEYFKQSEYDRITSTGGYESDPVLSNEEAFDIF